eukprot:jgi/Chrzof1/14087/Cz08g24200.t1
MGKKKKRIDDKPWCFYCDRLFSDEATLVQHQKNKHYKCPDCNRKLNTAQGLVVHAYQVHKLNITAIPGAKPGRESTDREIFGMAGIPEGARPGAPFGEGERLRHLALHGLTPGIAFHDTRNVCLTHQPMPYNV